MDDKQTEIEAFKARSGARDTASQSGVSDEYEAKMIEAFVGKEDEPERGFWYANAFSKYNVNGVDSMRWNWSWWALMGGIFFLLYRKAYAAAGGLFLISLVSGIIPFGGVIILILSGGYSPFFVYKVFKTKKLEIEAVEGDENKRIEMMKMLGGYNQWVIWVAVILNVLFLLAFVLFASAIMDAASQPGSY